MIQIRDSNNSLKSVKDIFIGDKRVYEVVTDDKIKYYYGGPYKDLTDFNNLQDYINNQPFYNSNTLLAKYNYQTSASSMDIRHSGNLKGFFAWSPTYTTSASITEGGLEARYQNYHAKYVFRVQNTSPGGTATLTLTINMKSYINGAWIENNQEDTLPISSGHHPTLCALWLYRYGNNTRMSILYDTQNLVQDTVIQILSYDIEDEGTLLKKVSSIGSDTWLYKNCYSVEIV